MESKKHIDLKVKRKKTKILFDEEIITKDCNEILLLDTNESKSSQKKQKKQWQREDKNEHDTHDTMNEITSEQKTTKENLKSSISTKIRKKSKRSASKSKIDTSSTNLNSTKKEQDESETQEEIQEELNQMQPTIKSTESLRKRKKKRHMDLLDAKRVKTELTLQQKAINYLSKWKHSKEQWKFEKLTQVWIQNSLYDETKLPDKIWATVLEYFESAKGKVRNDILNKAVTLCDSNSVGENSNLALLNRAKSIVQSLRE